MISLRHCDHERCQRNLNTNPPRTGQRGKKSATPRTFVPVSGAPSRLFWSVRCLVGRAFGNLSREHSFPMSNLNSLLITDLRRCYQEGNLTPALVMQRLIDSADRAQSRNV